MEQGPARRPALPTVSFAAASAAGVSLAVVAVPWLRMSVEAPSLRVALETGGSLLAVTTVVLLLRQCGLRSRADHLWLTAGLCILALTALSVAGMIIAGAWSPKEARYAMAGNLAGTVMLAIAAFAPTHKLRVRPRTILLSAAGLGVVLFALAALLAGVSPPRIGAADARWPSFHPELGRLIVQLAIAVSLVAAAVGLARRANQRQEPLLRWIAVAVVLGGFAKLDYALFPPLGADNVHLGDALRVAAWIALFAGVLGEMRARMGVARRGRPRSASGAASPANCTTASPRNSRSSAAAPAASPRRRTAPRSSTPPSARLEDSRRAIEALVPPAHEPLSVALERLGARLANECGLEVQVNVRVLTEVSNEVRAEIVRIISEAVRNAAHHGGARHVRVDLSGAPLSVRVIDDGCGFRDGASSGLGVAGYGLIAMRERAEEVGGKFSLESVRGAGTLVQVVLP